MGVLRGHEVETHPAEEGIYLEVSLKWSAERSGSLSGAHWRRTIPVKFLQGGLPLGSLMSAAARRMPAMSDGCRNCRISLWGDPDDQAQLKASIAIPPE